MRMPSARVQVEAPHVELAYWLKRESISASRWGYGLVLLGLAQVLIGGQSFLRQLDAGAAIEKMNFPGQLPLWGLIFGVFGLLQLVRAPRYYRLLRRIVAGGRPVAMYMTVRVEEDSESTSYYADLRFEPASAASIPDIEVVLALPPWSKGRDRLEQKPQNVSVRVYGTQAGGPAVIETAWGFLWPSSDRGATKYR